MQGEMSATVFYYPESYVKLIPDLKQRLATGQASASNIRIGVSTNFDKLCGCVLQARPPPCQLSHGCSQPGSMLSTGAGGSQACMQGMTVFTAVFVLCRTW